MHLLEKQNALFIPWFCSVHRSLQKAIQGYGIDILRRKGGPCGHRTGFPPVSTFQSAWLKISVAAHFCLKIQLQAKEKTACGNAHQQVSSCFQKDRYLSALIPKRRGLALWRSCEQSSSHHMADPLKWAAVPFYTVQVSSPDVCMDPIPITAQIQRYQKT